MTIGAARQPFAETFTAFARIGGRSGANFFSPTGIDGPAKGGMTDFDEIVGAYMNRSPLNREAIHLNLTSPTIDEKVFYRQSLSINEGMWFASNRDEWDDFGGVFQNPINQGGPVSTGVGGGGNATLFIPGAYSNILTDSAYTSITPRQLGNEGAGFHIRSWGAKNYNPASLTITLQTNGQLPYTQLRSDVSTAGWAPPTHEVIFKRPNGVAASNQLVIVSIERFGMSGKKVLVTHYDQQTADSLVVTTHAGHPDYDVESGLHELDGQVLKQEVLTYLNRGDLIWDYTLDRMVSETELKSDGTYGDLQLISHTQETYQDFSLPDPTKSAGYTPFVPGQEGPGDFIGGLPNGSRLMVFVNDPQGRALTTTYDYFNDPEKEELHGRLKSESKPDGSWMRYKYLGGSGSNTKGIVEYSSWKDVTLQQYTQGKKTETIIEPEKFVKIVSVAGVEIERSEATITISGQLAKPFVWSRTRDFEETVFTMRRKVVGDRWSTEVRKFIAEPQRILSFSGSSLDQGKRIHRLRPTRWSPDRNTPARRTRHQIRLPQHRHRTRHRRNGRPL